MKIKFYAAGGTIDKVYFDAKSEYRIGKPQIEEILEEANVAFEYEVDSILRKDSLEMTEADRTSIRRLTETENLRANPHHARHGHDGRNGKSIARQ